MIIFPCSPGNLTTQQLSSSFREDSKYFIWSIYALTFRICLLERLRLLDQIPHWYINFHFWLEFPLPRSIELSVYRMRYSWRHLKSWKKRVISCIFKIWSRDYFERNSHVERVIFTDSFDKFNRKSVPSFISWRTLRLRKRFLISCCD